MGIYSNNAKLCVFDNFLHFIITKHVKSSVQIIIKHHYRHVTRVKDVSGVYNLIMAETFLGLSKNGPLIQIFLFKVVIHEGKFYKKISLTGNNIHIIRPRSSFSVLTSIGSSVLPVG